MIRCVSYRDFNGPRYCEPATEADRVSQIGMTNLDFRLVAVFGCDREAKIHRRAAGRHTGLASDGLRRGSYGNGRSARLQRGRASFQQRRQIAPRRDHLSGRCGQRGSPRRGPALMGQQQNGSPTGRPAIGNPKAPPRYTLFEPPVETNGSVPLRSLSAYTSEHHSNTFPCMSYSQTDSAAFSPLMVGFRAEPRKLT